MSAPLPKTWIEVRARPVVLGAVILGCLTLLILSALAIFLLLRAPASRGGTTTFRHGASTAPSAVVSMDITQALIDPTQLRPISREDAMAFNSSIPISKEPNPPAQPFTMAKADPQDRVRAQECLTAAVYFEAAIEPEAGKRAVAQAVLNRVRHFAYPKTVCGVVFQGSERDIGCQFTFTCDGSMMHPIIERLWTQAHAVAVAALDGFVEKSVGYATHYHAIYVAPYWQPTLLKVAVIDHHIFYRGMDGWGRPSAFISRYAGKEPEIAAMAAVASTLPSPPDLVVAPDTPMPPASNAIAEPVLVPKVMLEIGPSRALPEQAPAALALPAAHESVLPTKRRAAPREPVRRRLPM